MDMRVRPQQVWASPPIVVPFVCDENSFRLLDEWFPQQYESSLLKVVKNDVSGNFGKMITYSLMETDAFGAQVFTTATKGQ